MRETTTTYTNRLIDLEFVQTITEPTGSKAMSISIAKSTPKIVSGIQKLAQRYTNIFLTVAGEVKFDQTVGTDFIRAVVGGYVSNFGRFFEAFAIANTMTLDRLREDTAGLPYDEIIQTAELVDFDIRANTGTIMLKVKIISTAGDDYVYVVPVETLKG